MHMYRSMVITLLAPADNPGSGFLNLKTAAYHGHGSLVVLHAVDLLLVSAAAGLPIEKGLGSGAAETVGDSVLTSYERHAAAAVVVVSEIVGAEVLLTDGHADSDDQRRCWQ